MWDIAGAGDAVDVKNVFVAETGEPETRSCHQSVQCDVKLLYLPEPNHRSSRYAVICQRAAPVLRIAFHIRLELCVDDRRPLAHDVGPGG